MLQLSAVAVDRNVLVPIRHSSYRIIYSLDSSCFDRVPLSLKLRSKEASSLHRLVLWSSCFNIFYLSSFAHIGKYRHFSVQSFVHIMSGNAPLTPLQSTKKPFYKQLRAAYVSRTERYRAAGRTAAFRAALRS